MTAGSEKVIASTILCEDAMPTYCSHFCLSRCEAAGVCHPAQGRNRVAPQPEAMGLSLGEGPETEELEGEQVARPIPGAPHDADAQVITSKLKSGLGGNKD